MSRFYPLAQGVVVLLWLGLLSTCSKPASPATFSATSHHIRFELQSHAASFLAIDTVKIEYHKRTQRLYFSLHRDLILHGIRVGNQAVSFRQYAAADPLNRLLPSRGEKAPPRDEDNWYEIKFPPHFEPDFLEITYSGAWPDALLKWPGYNRLDQKQPQWSPQEWSELQRESWFPQMPHSKVALQVQFVTHAEYAHHL